MSRCTKYFHIWKWRTLNSSRGQSSSLPALNTCPHTSQNLFNNHYLCQLPPPYTQMCTHMHLCRHCLLARTLFCFVLFFLSYSIYLHLKPVKKLLIPLESILWIDCSWLHELDQHPALLLPAKSWELKTRYSKMEINLSFFLPTNIYKNKLDSLDATKWQWQSYAGDYMVTCWRNLLLKMTYVLYFGITSPLFRENSTVKLYELLQTIQISNGGLIIKGPWMSVYISSCSILSLKFWNKSQMVLLNEPAWALVLLLLLKIQASPLICFWS